MNNQFEIGEKSDEEYKRMKDLIKILNMDLINREDELTRIKRLDRDKKVQNLMNIKLQAQVISYLK